jgi:hypothetical protein
MYHRTKIRKIGNCTSTGMGKRRIVKILQSLLYIALVALVSYRFYGNRIFVSPSKFAGSLSTPMILLFHYLSYVLEDCLILAK